MATPKSDTKVATIHEALVAFQAECPAVYKSQKHQQGFKFATLEDWTDTVGPILAKHGLALVTSYTDAVELEKVVQRSGSEWFRVRVRATGTLYHASGESITFEAFGEGADPSDKGIYKALTGARKYLLAAVSGAATTDDPESGRQSEEAPRAAAPKAAPTPAPAAASPPRPKAAAAVITAGQVSDCWKVFRARVLAVAPDATKDDVEAAYRGILQAVAGVESTKDVPAAKLAVLTKALAGWLPQSALTGASEPFGDEADDETRDGYGS